MTIYVGINNLTHQTHHQNNFSPSQLRKTLFRWNDFLYILIKI